MAARANCNCRSPPASRPLDAYSEHVSEENEARDAQLSFELPRETKEQFEQLARRRGHAPHVVLREFVNTYVAYEANVRVVQR